MKLSFPKVKKPVGQEVSIGLDIGHSYIKLVILRREDDKVFLDNFCTHYVPASDATSAPGESESIPVMLKKIISECDLPVKQVNISLSGKSTIVRDLWMPHMSPKDLKVSLGYEIDQYVPFPVEEIYYDSYILEENTLTRKNNQMRVVLAVAKKDFINERIKWLKEAGFVPNIIDMDAISIFNLFELGASEKGTVGLVDIGCSKTIIDIVSNNVLTFTREVEYGTINIREWAARGLSVGEDEAENLICAGDAKISGWVQDLVSAIGKELWNSFEYYEGQEQKPVEKVYITGGGSLLPEFVNLLSQTVGLPVAALDPLAKLKIDLDDAKKEKIHKIAPLFSVAIGIAYRFL